MKSKFSLELVIRVMAKPSISIITVSYQAASTLETALNSVRRQNIDGLEHIVQDAGSTDDTQDIVSAFPQVRFVQEADRGIYDGLNKAIKNTKGDVIGLLHADDFYADENVLRRVLAAFEANPDIMGIYGDLRYVSAGDTSKINRHWRAGKFSSIKLKLGWMPPHPTLFLRREVYEELGLFNLEYKISADYDFVIRLFSSHADKIEYLPEVLVHMRTGGISNSGIRNLLLKSQEDLDVARGAGFNARITVFCKVISKLRQFRLISRTLQTSK